MNTLEYLQLTYDQKVKSHHGSIGYGIFIYGNENQGVVRDWSSYEKLRYQFSIFKGKFHGEYKIWSHNGKLIDHRIYKNGKIVKDYFKGKIIN